MLVKEIIRTYSSKHNGYLQIRLAKRPLQGTFLVHRLVAQHFIPNPENKPEVNHKWGNKEDNRASELEWVTEKENSQDAVRKGIKRFDKPKRDRIADDVVLEIYNEKGSLGELSKKYNLPKLTIHSIKSGKRYGRITKENKNDRNT
jgi:hypothetical protein